MRVQRCRLQKSIQKKRQREREKGNKSKRTAHTRWSGWGEVCKTEGHEGNGEHLLVSASRQVQVFTLLTVLYADTHFGSYPWAEAGSVNIVTGGDPGAYYHHNRILL